MTRETTPGGAALRLLPRRGRVGYAPADGEEIVALNGRYGPYLKKGSDSRSLDSEDQLFTVNLEQALAKFAEPKQRRGQKRAAPLREIGPHPVTGAPILIKKRGFGAFLTH